MNDELNQLDTVFRLTAKGSESVRLRARLTAFADELRRSEENRRNQRLVLDAVIKGYSDVKDIAAATQFSYNRCHRILKRLVRQGKLEERRTLRDGQPGRRKYCYTVKL